MPQILYVSEIPKPRRAYTVHTPRLRRSIAGIVAMALLLLGGICFRVEQLGAVPGLNGDEAWSGVQAVRFLHGETIAWRTPTGNPLNVFLLGPLVVLHAMLPPSVALLRTVSVASGLLALGLNYWLCRRAFDQTTAIVSTLLLAVLPVTIAYSRFAWDASQTPLASVLVIYASMTSKRSLLPMCFALMAAIVVHPTNLFLLPIAAALALPLERIRVNRLLVFLGVVVAAAALLLLRGPAELQAFAVNLLRLFSGSTVYQFISGGVSPGDITVADLATLTVGMAALCSLASRWKHESDPRDFRLVVGTLAALAAFLVVAGPEGVQPHTERYALWCVVPIALIASRGAAFVWDRTGSRSLKLALFAYPALLLVGFQLRYFDVFAQTGGESHLAFRTGDRDPKQAALTQIEATIGKSRAATIVSQSWWTRLPLQYFAAGKPNLRVVDALPCDIDCKRVWFVELAGSEAHLRLLEPASTVLDGHERSSCNDRAGREVVVVYSPNDSAPDSLKKFVPARFDNEAN